MKFDYETILSTDRETLWDYLMSVNNVAACLDGVKSVEEIDENHYEGLMKVKMGPVSFSFNCSVEVEIRDKANWHGKIKADAKEKKLGGGFSSYLDMKLLEISPHESQLNLELESTIFGKIGEYGQPLIRKRINRMLNDFIKKLNENIG